MESNRETKPLQDIRRTEFTLLKEQQCSLNMQIRLAMQLHDTQAQADLEKKLTKVTEQINRLIW